jgi:hypothetical protein
MESIDVLAKNNPEKVLLDAESIGGSGDERET